MHRVLVTGCAGFIGSHLTERLLKEGFEVFGIDCFTDYYSPKIKKENIERSMKSNKFRLAKSDILEMTKFPHVDFVFHQAAQPGVRSSWGKKFDVYVKNNILVTQRLLEFYKDKNLSKFVYASSSSVYGNSSEQPTSENSSTRPISPYGVTKLGAENLCQLYHVNFHLPVICLRYFTVYGPRQRPDMAISKFLKAVLEKKEITLFGSGNQTRDFTYVEDIVEANILAMKQENIEGEVFNIGNGSPISLKELVKVLSQVTGSMIKVNHIKVPKGDVKDTWADIGRQEGH